MLENLMSDKFRKEGPQIMRLHNTLWKPEVEWKNSYH